MLPATRLVRLRYTDISTWFHIVVRPKSAHNTTSFLPGFALMLIERPEENFVCNLRHFGHTAEVKPLGFQYSLENKIMSDKSSSCLLVKSDGNLGLIGYK